MSPSAARKRGGRYDSAVSAGESATSCWTEQLPGILQLELAIYRLDARLLTRGHRRDQHNFHCT